MLILSINGCPPSSCIVQFCSPPSLGGRSRCSPTRRSSDQPNGNSQDLHGSLTTSISVGKAVGNLSLNWGERDTQLYLMKFTGQAKSCCSICGSGDHYPYGCSLSALRPNNTHQGLCNNYNRGTKCSQAPCPFSHRCKTCYGDHPAYRHDDPPSKTRSQTDKKSTNR